MKFFSIAVAAVLASSSVVESRLEGGRRLRLLEQDPKTVVLRDLATSNVAEEWNADHGKIEMHTQDYTEKELGTMTNTEILKTASGNSEMQDENILLEGDSGYQGGTFKNLPPPEKVDEVTELVEHTEELKQQALAAEAQMQQEVGNIVETYVETEGAN